MGMPARGAAMSNIQRSGIVVAAFAAVSLSVPANACPPDSTVPRPAGDAAMKRPAPDTRFGGYDMRLVARALQSPAPRMSEVRYTTQDWTHAAPAPPDATPTTKTSQPSTPPTTLV